MGRVFRQIRYRTRLLDPRGAFCRLGPKRSAYLGCGDGAVAVADTFVVGAGDVAFATARDDMPGSCGSDVDEADSGRDMGSRIGGGRI